MWIICCGLHDSNFFWGDVLDSALHHHYQNTKRRNVFWKDGAHPSVSQWQGELQLYRLLVDQHLNTLSCFFLSLVIHLYVHFTLVIWWLLLEYHHQVHIYALDWNVCCDVTTQLLDQSQLTEEMAAYYSTFCTSSCVGKGLADTRMTRENMHIYMCAWIHTSKHTHTHTHTHLCCMLQLI